MSATDIIVLENADLRMELRRLGATLARLDLRLADGSWRNVVLGSASEADYLGPNIYLGMTVGRFANRIGGARFVLDGTTHEVDANEGPNQLHGGTQGFHSRVWEVAGQGPDWVEFSLCSPDGDQGFPGELDVSARYELFPGGAKVAYRATTTAPTVVNLTNHAYFNLDGEASGNTDDHYLQVRASRYTPNHDDGIPTGEIRDVTGSAMDFRGWRHLGSARVAAEAEGLTRRGGFDHNFVVDGSGMREHCRLMGSRGLTLTVISDQPGLQVYCGDHFDGTQVGTSGTGYVRRAGVALETQAFPDAPNQPHFPSTVLRPGQTYRATTCWVLGESSPVVEEARPRRRG